MTLRVALALGLACFLFCAGAAGAAGLPVTGDPTAEHYGDTPGVLGADTALAQSSPPETSALQAPPETDATVTDIRVQPNGSAVYSLTIRMAIGSDQAEAEFAAFESEFRANRSSYRSEFRERLTGVVENAETVTDREMSATGFTAEVGTEAVPREWGFVSYSFRWNGFASVGSDGVTVGDVFEDDLFLEETDILLIRAPEGYETTAVAPTPDQTDGGVLRWEGPATFGDSRPTAEFVPPGSPDGGTGTPDDPGEDGTSGGGAGPISALMLVGAGAVVLVGAGVLYAHRRRQSTADSGADSEGTGERADGETSGDTTGGGHETREVVSEPDLATDEDRVVAALADADGRMRQSDLAEQLDWSASKTSRVLSDMAEDGQIEKLRIGRENVIDLLEED